MQALILSSLHLDARAPGALCQLHRCVEGHRRRSTSEGDVTWPLPVRSNPLWTNASLPRLRLDIERAAKITVSEDQRRMRFVKWKPMPTDAHPKVDESGEGRPQTAEEGNPFAQVHSGNQEAA